MKLNKELQPVLLRLSVAERAKSLGKSEPVATPEQLEFEKAQRNLIGQRNAAASAQMAVDDMENEILRIQADERKLRRRVADDKAQLGAELDPDKRRDLEHDLYAAKSRIADLMSELQEAHNEIHALRANVDVHGARIDSAQQAVEVARRAAEAANDAAENLPDPQEEIDSLRAQLPEDVVAEFDAVRAINGVGVAEFKSGKTCGGCFIVLPPADLSVIRNADAEVLPECPDCGCYLVRPS